MEITDLACLNGGGDASSNVGSRDRGARDGSAAAVNDCSNDVTAGGLAPCGKIAA
jgi:hypothetical protein